jgi:hypothetical protein
MGEMFTGVGTEIARREIERLKVRIVQLEAKVKQLREALGFESDGEVKS